MLLLRMYGEEGLEWSVVDIALIGLFFAIVFWSEYRPSWMRIPLDTSIYDKTGKKRKLAVEDIPGPLRLPILGTRWIYYGRYKLSKIHEAYRDMFSKYGSIIREDSVWNFPVISVMERADIEKVLRHASRYPLRPPTEVTAHYRASRPDRYTNLGLINEQGETWHKLRTLLTPELISAKTMNRFLPELNNVADDFISLLMNSRDSNGMVHGFDQLASRMGLESTCTLILGRRLGFLELEVSPKASRLAQAVKDQFCASRDTFYGLPLWKILPTPAYTKFMRSENIIYDIISELVDDALKDEKDTCDVDAVQSVFMAILQAPGLDVRDKKAGIIDFIAAGIKTLGNTLVFLLYLIAKHPECQKKLYEEVINLAPSGTPLTSQILRGAPYLRACMMEAFRLLPTAPCVARIVESDVELSGYHVRSGSVVLCHTWLACLQEANFSQAEKFLPQRWLENDSDASGVSACADDSATSLSRSNPFLVVPFGVGRRMCPGKRFVELELQVVLAQAVRQFEIEFDGELELEFEFLLAPKTPANFRFKERF